jgi:hypothetical protein
MDKRACVREARANHEAAPIKIENAPPSLFILFAAEGCNFGLVLSLLAGSHVIPNLLRSNKLLSS